MSNILRYKQLEYLKCDSLNRLIRAYSMDLLNLKKFSIRGLDEAVGLDFVLSHPLLEKLCVGLGYDDDKILQLNLVKYKGFLLVGRNDRDIDLTRLFSTRLEKLEIRCTINNRRLISIQSFSQLKSLILFPECNVDLDFNFGEFLPNLETLDLSSKVLYIANILNLKKLKKLRLTDVNFNNSTLTGMPDFSSINELVMINPINLNEEQVKLLFFNMANLKKLRIGHIKATFLKFLSKTIEILEFFKIPRAAENIQHLVNLKEIISTFSRDIRHSDMKFINSLKSLESLTFFPDLMKSTSAYDIKGLDKLEKIKLIDSNSKFTKSFSRYLPSVEIISG